MRKTLRLQRLNSNDAKLLGFLVDRLTDYRDWYISRMTHIVIIEDQLSKSTDMEEVGELYEIRCLRVQELIDRVRRESNELKSLFVKFPRKIDVDYKAAVMRDILPKPLYNLTLKALQGVLEDSALD